MTLQIFDENNLMDGHCLSPHTCKHCNGFKILDQLNLDCLTGNC